MGVANINANISTFIRAHKVVANNTAKKAII